MALFDPKRQSGSSTTAGQVQPLAFCHIHLAVRASAAVTSDARFLLADGGESRKDDPKSALAPAGGAASSATFARRATSARTKPLRPDQLQVDGRVLMQGMGAHLPRQACCDPQPRWQAEEQAEGQAEGQAEEQAEGQAEGRAEQQAEGQAEA